MTMELHSLGEYVALSQGLAINAGTSHLVSNTKSDKFSLPLLRIADMISNHYEKYASNDVQKSVIASSEDIIYTRTGQIGLAFTGKQGVVHNNSFIVKLISDEICYDYLYVILQSDFVREQALNFAKNSVQPDLTHDMFKSIKIPVPPTPVQRKIADIYLRLDKKIKFNNAINDNLQQMAKTIYDYWFTQFDFPDENGKPYRSSGGQMVWNEQLKREIPAGWTVKKMSEILQKNAKVFDYSSSQPTIDLSVMPSNSIALSQLNFSDNFTTNLFEMKRGDILFGSIRPYLHKAGIAPCDGVVAGTVHSYQVKKWQDYNFALITLARDIFFNYAVNVSSGTKMPVVSSNSILAYQVPYNDDVVKKFSNISLMETITQNVQESQQLVALRDWLLPMLMNGQATVAD